MTRQTTAPLPYIRMLSMRCMAPLGAGSHRTCPSDVCECRCHEAPTTTDVADAQRVAEGE